MAQRKICILSLDGGGIRGILPGVILAAVEHGLREIDGEHARLADYFDLVAGTSTGGILTCGYLVPDESGRPKYRAEDVVALYRERGDRIFQKGHIPMILKSLTNAKYEVEGLENELEKFFGDAELRDLLKPCLVSSYEIGRRRAVFFNKVDGSTSNWNFLVRHVARATSAAPTFFQASRIESLGDEALGDRRLSLIDGGLVANNPGMCAYAEARSMNFREALDDPLLPDRNPSARDMVLISIGTGKPKEKEAYDFEEAKDWGVLGWVAPIIDIMMSANAETVDYQLNKMFATVEDEGGVYRRLEPLLHEASEQMDDITPDNLEALWQDALTYVADHHAEIRFVVELLKKHGAGPPPAPATGD